MKIFLIEHFRAVRRAKQPARRLSEVGFYEGYFMQESPLKKVNMAKPKHIISKFADYTEEDFVRDTLPRMKNSGKKKVTFGERMARFVDKLIKKSEGKN